nr:hypothetical protein [Rhizoctonia sp.]
MMMEMGRAESKMGVQPFSNSADLCGQRQKASKNARLMFRQGTVHKDYLLHLYDKFGNYCPIVPKMWNEQPHAQTGKIYNKIGFITYSLPCFNEYYNLFYPEGKKIVPINIADLFTVYSLAYWLADDGSFHKKNRCVTLNTQSFSLEEVNLLAKTLNDKWDLKCAVHKSRDGFTIYISSKSLSILQGLLKDVMPPMMLHKIGL